MNIKLAIEKIKLALLDAVIAILLLVFCVYAGRQHLDSLNQERSPVTSIEMLYGPAVMLASGRGFYQPDLDYAPALRAFLRNERETLSPAALPEVLPEEPNSVSSYHRYLLYTVALFFHIYGISWASLEPLCAILLGVCAVAVYGILRLGMGRLLSAPLTLLFVLSPQMLTMLPSLRDFSKAPFILLLIFLLGLLIKYRFGMKALAGISLLLGLVNGVAMGFRQDALVFIFPACVIVTVSVFRYERPFLCRRLLAPVLLLAAFFAVGHPMLGRMEGGAQPYHPLVQGFSMKRSASLGMKPDAYEVLASGSDNYTFAMLRDYVARVNGEGDENFAFNSPGSEIAGRQFITDMVVHFPADLLARGYAALLRTFRYTDGIPVWDMAGSFWKSLFEKQHYWLKHHLHGFGWLYAALAALIISAINLPLAFGLLVFVLYVCGYVSLQCEFRHAFQLSFLPLWVLGFLSQCFFAGFVKLFRLGTLDHKAWLIGLQRAGVFVVCSTVLIMGPLLVLRFYQQYRVSALLKDIASSERKLVPVNRMSEIAWERFTLAVPGADDNTWGSVQTRRDVEALCVVLSGIIRYIQEEDRHPVWHTKTHYYALELASTAADMKWMTLLYESTVPMNNFSQVIRMHLPITSGDSVFYYFPAYELKMPADDQFARNRFTGFALPEAYANAFRGLYEVENLSRIRFLLHAMLPSNHMTPVRKYQRIQVWPDPLDAYRVEDEPVAMVDMADAAKRFGRDEEALLLYCAALLVNMGTAQRLRIAHQMIGIGEYDDASRVILDSLDGPESENSYAVSLLGEVIGHQIEQGKLESAEKMIDSLHDTWSETHPNLMLELIELFDEAGHTETFLNKLKYLLFHNPENKPAADLLEVRMQKEKDVALLIEFWQEVAQKRPKSVLPFLRLGRLWEVEGNLDKARAAYTSACANNPLEPEAIIHYSLFLLESGESEDMLEQVVATVKNNPQYQQLTGQLLEQTGDRISSAGKYGIASMVYEQAGVYAPENLELKRKRARCLVNAGQFLKAQEVLEALLNYRVEDEALTLLDRLWAEHKSDRERMEAWQDITIRYPQEGKVQCRYAETLFSLGRFSEAASYIAEMDDDWGTRPEQKALLRLARFAAGQETEETLVQDDLWSQHPELKAQAYALLEQTVLKLEKQSQFNEALRLMSAATMFAPESGNLLLELGRNRENSGKYGEALDIYWSAFGKLRGRERRHVAGLIDALYDRMKAPTERLQRWFQAYQTTPEDQVVLYHLSLAQEVNGLWQDAIEGYQKLDVGSEEVKTLAMLRRGALLARLGEAERGVHLMQSSIEAAPQLQSLGAMLCQQTGGDLFLEGKVEEAGKVIDLAAKLAPQDPFVLLQQGDIYKALGMGKQATQVWRSALFHGVAGVPGAEAGRRLDAALPVNERLQLWNEMRTAHPEALLPQARYALALAANGDLDAALGLCQSLADAAQENSEVQVACALVSCFAGHVEAGLAQVNRAMEAAPHLVSPIVTELAGLGLQKLESGRPEEAEPLIRKAIELGPDNLLYYVYLGRAMLSRGTYEEAAAQFRKVLLHVPESPNAARLLDEAWAGMNDPQKQRQDWSAIVEAHPEAKIPREHLEALN